MRTESQYPELENKLQNFLNEMAEASEDFDEMDFRERLFQELKKIIPNFNGNRIENHLFELIDNRLDLQDTFTIDEIRDIVRLMICIGCDANSVNSEEEKLLSVAISFGDPEVVEILIEGDAQINTTTNHNSDETMLLKAVQGYGICDVTTHEESKVSYFKIVETLVKKGARKEQVLNSRLPLVTEEMRKFVTDIYDKHEFLKVAATISNIASLPTRTQEQSLRNKTSQLPQPEPVSEIVKIVEESPQEKFDRLFNGLVEDSKVLHSRTGKVRGQCGSDFAKLFPLINSENIDTVRQNFSVMNLVILFGTLDQLETLVSKKPENLNLPDSKSVLSSAAIGNNIAMRDFLLRQNLTISVVQSGFEEAIRSGKRGGNQGFADKILEAVRNAAKSSEVERRSEGIGKYFVLGELENSPAHSDRLRALNNASGKHIAPKVIDDYCSALKQIFTKNPLAKSKAKSKLKPVSLEEQKQDDVVQDNHMTDFPQTIDKSDQVLLGPEFYKSLRDYGIDLKRDFAGLFGKDNLEFLSLDEFQIELDESYPAVGDTPEIREFIEDLLRIRKEKEAEQQRLDAANGLRPDAPSFVPSVKLVEHLDAKTKSLTK